MLRTSPYIYYLLLGLNILLRPFRNSYTTKLSQDTCTDGHDNKMHFILSENIRTFNAFDHISKSRLSRHVKIIVLSTELLYMAIEFAL